jgi:fructose-1,6-bisphosphatase
LFSEPLCDHNSEVVKKLDVIANEAFITALKRSKKVSVMVR